MALRCLIVDDNPEFIAAARELLHRERLEVVGTASSGADALRLAGELRPDVALVDIYLGPEDGFDVAARLAEADGAWGPAVILISTYSEKDFADVIAESPAVGFVAKSELSGAAIRRLLGVNDGPGR